MAYKKGSEKVYFPGIIALLVAIAALIGTFIYQVFMVANPPLEGVLIDDSGEQIMLSPNGNGPDSPPSFEQPTTPPPAN